MENFSSPFRLLLMILQDEQYFKRLLLTVVIRHLGIIFARHFTILLLAELPSLFKLICFRYGAETDDENKTLINLIKNLFSTGGELQLLLACREYFSFARVVNNSFKNFKVIFFDPPSLLFASVYLLNSSNLCYSLSVKSIYFQLYLQLSM